MSVVASLSLRRRHGEDDEGGEEHWYVQNKESKRTDRVSAGEAK